MNSKTLIFSLLIVLMTGCEKVTPDNMSVRKYINLLKSDSYIYNDLPAFSPGDIPELLKYADDDKIITKYPINPISSFIGEDPRPGIFVLWTIESIRLSSNGPSGRFPSLTPGLWNAELQEPADVSIAHPVVSQAYKSWWDPDINYELLKSINPLENTGYGWR